MELTNPTQLLSQIKEGTVCNLYYLWGDDVANIEALVHKMAKKLSNGDENAITRFDGGELDLNTLEELVEQYPMFSDYNILLINDLDLEQQRENNTKRIMALLERLSDVTVLIIYQTGVDICGGRKKPTPKNQKLIDKIKKAGCSVIVKKKDATTLASEFCERAKRYNVSISRENAMLIVERCLCSALLIQNEFQKLMAYANGMEITREMIDLLVVGKVETDCYALAKCVVTRNSKEVFRLFETLITYEEPDVILNVLSGSMLDLYRAATAMGCGKQAESTGEDFEYGKRSFALQNAFRDCRKMSLDQIRSCIDILTKTTADLHSVRVDSKQLLEYALVQMLRVKK